MSTVITGGKMTRLLYVDDELDILLVVKKGLENYGFSVDVATSAEVALLMDLPSYDMIIIDIRMPKINGFQFYDAIKNRINSGKTKVCFFTAFTTYQEEYQRRFPTWNGCYFITKPMSVKVLAEKLRELLQS